MAAPTDNQYNQNPTQAGEITPEISSEEIVPQEDRAPFPAMPDPMSNVSPSIPTEQQTQPFAGFGGDGRFPIKKIVIIGLLVLGFLGAVIFGISRLRTQSVVSQEVNLTWWGLWEDASLVQPVVDEYEKANPKVKISYIKQSHQDYRERLSSSLARGSGPDIFRYHNTWVPMLRSELAPLPSEIMDAAAYTNTFYPVAVQDLTVSGKITGIPLMIDGLALFVNEGLFEEAGVASPSTWEDVRRVALALTKRDGQGQITQAGIALGTTNNTDHWQDVVGLMFLQNGADLTNPTGKRAEDALLFYTLFVLTDKVWDETLPPSTLAFSGGRLAMYLGPSWRVFEIRKQNPNIRFRVLPVPQLPKLSPDDRDITWASYWVEGVWERSQKKNEAFRFLKFLSEKEQLEKLYTNAAKVRLFGEPYPRQDVASLLLDDPLVGAYIKQAPTARSWYLAGSTFDGPTGINSRLSKYFEDAINSILKGETPDRVVDTLRQGVQQVLGTYGIK